LDLLLDTHTLLWWLRGDPALSMPARAAIGDTGNTVYVSTASVWEIATKFRIGKLPNAAANAAGLAGALAAEGFVSLPISLAHGRAAGALPGALPGPHRDPFDRMLMAQAMLGDLVLMSNEQRFDAYGVRRLW
jgi:PIN domain nuclease of toxin-antitoxin system